MDRLIILLISIFWQQLPLKSSGMTSNQVSQPLHVIITTTIITITPTSFTAAAAPIVSRLSHNTHTHKQCLARTRMMKTTRSTPDFSKVQETVPLTRQLLPPPQPSRTTRPRPHLTTRLLRRLRIRLVYGPMATTACICPASATFLSRPPRLSNLWSLMPIRV